MLERGENNKNVQNSVLHTAKPNIDRFVNINIYHIITDANIQYFHHTMAELSSNGGHYSRPSTGHWPNIQPGAAFKIVNIL